MPACARLLVPQPHQVREPPACGVRSWCGAAGVRGRANRGSPAGTAGAGGRGKRLDSSARRLVTGKRGVRLGTEFGLPVQGISNSSSSKGNVYLGNYEKSYNNVLFTAFVIGSLGPAQSAA